MYRVVTKRLMVKDGQIRRDTQFGPWQPSEEPVKRWADYLRHTGFYERVQIESMQDRAGVQTNRF